MSKIFRILILLACSLHVATGAAEMRALEGAVEQAVIVVAYSPNAATGTIRVTDDSGQARTFQFKRDVEIRINGLPAGIESLAARSGKRADVIYNLKTGLVTSVLWTE